MKRPIVALVAVLAAIGAAGRLGAQGTTGAAQGTSATQAPVPVPGTVAAQKSTVIQKIIVKVNGEIFTQSELEFRQIQAIKNENQNLQIRNSEDLNTDPGLRAALAKVTPTLLIEAVDQLMLVQHAREINLKFSETIFSDWVAQSKKENKLDDQTFLIALKQEGLTLAELRANIERAWLAEMVEQRELARNMTLTLEESRQYYDAHQDQFMKPSTVTLREILIAVPADTVGGKAMFNVSADETARQKIVAIRERAQKGEDYATLVTEVSESGTKANGGLIEIKNTSELSPALSELLDKMKPGDITEPIRTRAGYQIIKLESRTSGEVEMFEKSREQITQYILMSRRDVERAKFLGKLRLQAVIEWKDDACKKMYDTEREARAKTGPAKDGK